ncbi:MAG TPA: serine hydrolase [Gemmatimonadales bacterium]|jgi:beta-lactamase class A|nr:serine hydrolase [Gemmatimonadales bacterium]
MRRVGWLVLAAILLAIPVRHGAPQTPRPSAATSSGLQRLLEAELARFPAKAGVWVKHLTSGDEAAVRADESFNSASVIKLPVMTLAFQMADQGELSLSERITINASDFRGGSGIFRYNDPGLQPTFRDVLLQMIITSDNTATDLAIGKVGGVDRVNGWLRDHGYADALTLNMTTNDLFAKYRALPQGSNQNEKTNGDRAYWLGVMTPRATGRLIESIQRCSDGTAPAPAIAAPKSCADMIRMMRAQQSGARRLPHFLNVPVAHKTGDFPPVLANDVGVVFARSGPIVIAFFANAIEGPYGEAEDRIGRIAQLIVEYFDGAQ